MSQPLGYSGPSNEYVPPTGENSQSEKANPSLYNPIATYADVGYLNKILAALIVQCTNLISAMDGLLKNFALVVTTNPSDVNLSNAHEVLWPGTLGTAPSYITYLYYKSLANTNSAAAVFVRNAYEKAARGVTGSNAIDLLPITQMTLDEANLIQNFVNIYAGDLSDSSQRRTVELLQDWVESAQTQIQDAQTIFINDSNYQLNPTDVSSLSSTDVGNTQAILQVNLNKLNIQLTKDLGVLQKYFATYQSTFYNNVLGPAMGFRNNVLTNTYPIAPGALGTIVNASTGIINDDIKNVLTDQMRRNDVYTGQINTILTTVQARDGYRSYIIQLAAGGQAIPAGSQGTMVTATDTPDQASFFQAATAPDATPSNPYVAPHSQLSGLDDPQAHPQYLNIGGDTLYGNLDLAAGVLVDGMRPGTHAHTGADGTQQIHGSDILTGSVSSGVVDINDQPIVPTNIKVVSQNVDVISGTATVDIALSWDGDSNLLYEVQIAKAV